MKVNLIIETLGLDYEVNHKIDKEGQDIYEQGQQIIIAQPRPLIFTRKEWDKLIKDRKEWVLEAKIE